MRRVALLTLVFFGCATARPPSTPSLPLAGAEPGRVALAEPELELWLEGSHRVDPAEAARALDESRDALARALEGRGLDGVEAPHALLAIRVRAVTRTSERRTAQLLAAGGIVIGVALVIAAFIAGMRDSRKSRPAVARAAPLRGAGAGPGPWRARPLRPAPFLLGWSLGVHVAVPYRAPPVAPLHPASDPLLDPRGFFDGDEVELTAELVHPETGDVRWRRVLRDGVDVRDARGMRALVDRALAGAPLGRRGASEPPAGVQPGPAQPPRSPPPAPEGGPLRPDLDGDL